MIASYIKFLLKSGNKHAIHSPFLFDLYSRVISDKKDRNSVYDEIEKIRNKLLNNKESIEIVDLGAGSRVSKSNIRTIRSIAKNAEKPAKFGKLFYRIIQEFKPKTIIELGTCFGVTTLYLAKSAPNSTILSFEGCPETAKIAQKNFQDMNVENVEIKLGNIDEILPQVIKTLTSVDFVYFDANHRYEPTISYFETCLPLAHNDSIFIFDDIYWSEEMLKAWEEIKQHPQVTLTVDLFWIGLVFFRKEQPKEHFKLRF